MQVREIAPDSGIYVKYQGLLEEECPICLETYTTKDFEEKTIHMTRCNHFFHSLCIKKCPRPNSCPSCEQEIDVPSDEEKWKNFLLKIHLYKPQDISNLPETNFCSIVKEVVGKMEIFFGFHQNPLFEDEALAKKLQVEEDEVYNKRRQELQDQENSDRVFALQLQKDLV